MNNPHRILKALDSFLQDPLELTIYGRAALALGFHLGEPFTATLDVDVIIPAVEVDALDQNEDFWQAVEKVNREYESEGLYLTHLFLDKQVILREDWYQHRVPIPMDDLNHLSIYRPSTVDLILTKMMRVDPDDRKDIGLLLSHLSYGTAEWQHGFQAAIVPDVPEIRAAFEENQAWLLGSLG